MIIADPNLFFASLIEGNTLATSLGIVTVQWRKQGENLLNLSCSKNGGNLVLCLVGWLSNARIELDSIYIDLNHCNNKPNLLCQEMKMKYLLFSKNEINI